MDVRPAKTQISPGIHLVWSQSSLCAQWVAKDSICLHADSEDSDQTGQGFHYLPSGVARTELFYAHLGKILKKKTTLVSLPKNGATL